VNPLDQLTDPLRIVTTAVTPVVMVSATAILLSGVNARYLAVSDRMRKLAGEYRDVALTPARRENIQRQMLVFERRMGLVSWSSRILYVAICCFIVVALLICLSTWRHMLTLVTLPIFSVGIAMVGTAVVLQLLEVQASRRTLSLEAAEVLRDAKSLTPGRDETREQKESYDSLFGADGTHWIDRGSAPRRVEARQRGDREEYSGDGDKHRRVADTGVG
jgi:hypothetical protein